MLRAPAADDDRERRATPRHVHHEAGAPQEANLFCQRHVHVLIGPRFVDSPSARAAAECLAEMREPHVEVTRESARRRGRRAITRDQYAAWAQRAIASPIERQLGGSCPYVMQRVAGDDGVAGWQRLVQE